MLALAFGGWALSAQAFFSLGMMPGLYVPQSYYKHGAVYTRAIVPGPSGLPVYVEYDASGQEVREIGEAKDKYERAVQMSGSSYRAYLQQQQDVRTRYPTSEVMSAADYRGATFKTATGAAVAKPELSPSTLTVTVRAEAERFDGNGNDLLLLQVPIRTSTTISSSSQSLLLSPEGDVLVQTANTIGFRVGFFGKDGQVSDTLVRGNDANIYGPMSGVGVSLGGYIAGGFAVTGSDGRYSMRYNLPACPGFSFEYTTPAYLELQYKRFNPRGGSMMPYFMTRQDYDFCNGLGVYSMAAAAVVATSATPVKRPFDFPVDLMVLDGAATLQGARVGEATTYSAETSERSNALSQYYDFDGDEVADTVVPGKKVSKTVDGEKKEVFVTTSVEEAELQGIYLSSRHEGVPANTEEDGPDFTRLIDTNADFQNRGLLEGISKQDLQDTDIYVFRESNGQLVAERRGLHEDELYKTYSGVDDDAGAFRYTIQLRGSVENYYAIAGRTGEANFAKWQSAGGFKDEFQKRQANHLKAGEQVRIIAINRPTGYIGSTRIQLQSALSGNLINLNSQQIQMGPPNLKVWAERKNTIERGMTRGEQKRQLIGNEGAGLGSDVSIAIYSDWRDSDGSPLPEELADYGYTGRLAKIVAANQLAPVGANSLSQFKIKPGQQVQVIHLPERVLAKQHLYLQVAGQPESRNPDFSSDGSASGILKYRPTHFVPVLVPLHDEEASEIARQAYRKADRENPSLNLKAPEPQYNWRYRPEMQFSLYELNVDAIRKVDASQRTSDILDDARPVLTSSDELLTFYYDLIKSELASLDAYGHNGEKELVLAIGEQEIKATFGVDQSIRFDKFEHLGALDVDDYLSLRLYANNDVGNTLVEWAFEYLSIFGNEDEEMRDVGAYHYVSADDPHMEMKAVLAGYYTRRENIKKPETVRWQIEGAGNVSPFIDTNADSGIFTTRVSLPPIAGTRARVYAGLQGGDARAYYKDFIVIPGEPANITASFSGQLYAGGMGELKVDLTVTDRQGNRVISGTGADFSIEGQGRLLSDSETLVNGGAELTVLDALQAGDDNALVVQVDGVRKRFPFDVRSLVVTPPEIRGVRENQVVDLVFGLGGADATNIRPETIGVKVDKGVILDRSGQMDASGQLVYRWHTGYIPGPAKVVFNAGNGALNTQVWEVLPDPQSRIGQKKPIALVVGASNNQLSYRRSSSEQVSIPVLAQDSISLKGAPGESLDIRLGDSRNPNRALLTVLRPADLERSRFLVAGVTAAKAPGFRYQQSTLDGLPVAYNYKGYGLVLADGTPLEQTAADVGIQLFLEYEGSKNGQLLAWKDLLLMELRDGKLLVTRKLPGEQSETQEFDIPVSAGPNQLQVSIKGRHIAYRLAEVSGEFDLDGAVLPALGTGIRLLTGKDMALRQFYAHAIDAPALLSVNGQSRDFSLILDAQGEANLRVESMGVTLPQAYRSAPLDIAGERVDIALHSPEHALLVLSGLLELQTPDTDTMKHVLALDDRASSSYLAQANLVTRIVSADAQDGDKVAALLKVFSSLPEGGYLSGHLDSLIPFISAHANPAFQRLLKEELVELVLHRRYADVGLSYKRMLGLLVMSEMSVTHPDTAAYIQESVIRRQDLSLWLDWMAMPANGWAFLEASVPYVEQKCTLNVIYALEGTADQVPYNPCRLSGAVFANWVESIKAVAPEYENDPQYLLTLLDGMYDGLGESSYSFRRDLFSLQQGYDPLSGYDPLGWLVPRAHAAGPVALVPVLVIMARVAMQVAKRMGRNFAKNFTKFMTGKSNTRLNPLLFAVSASYVYTSVTCDEGSVIPCKRLQSVGAGSEDEAEKKFWSLIKHFSAGLALSSGRNLKIKNSISADGQYVCRLVNFTHGHMYEMFMIAFHHATSTQGIAALDRVRKVPLYGDSNDLSQMFVRRPDIELKGAEADVNTWIELKSLQAAAHDSNGSDSKLPSKAEFLKRKLPQLGREQGRSTYHRQFTLDRVAAYNMQGGDALSSGFKWQFQQWKEDAGPRNRLSNGYPTKTRIKGSDAGTYLEAAKERLIKPPLFFKSTDSKYPFHTDLDPIRTKDVFDNPLYDGLGENIDKQLAEKFLADLGYSAADVADITQRMTDSANILKVMEEVIKRVPGLEPGFGFDIIDLLPDEMLESVQDYIDENLGNMVGCEDD